MELTRFIARNKLAISPQILAACQDGLERMRTRGQDFFHTHNHSLRMLTDLDEMITHSPDIDWSSVDFEVLLLAIIWHDVWKSAQSIKRNWNLRSGLLCHVFYEGLGSMRMFTRYAKSHHLPKRISQAVRYAIRKHSLFQILPKSTIEAKILKDLDKLEEYSLARIQEVLDKIPSMAEIPPTAIKSAIMYFNYRTRASGSKGSFAWTQSELTKRKPIYRAEVSAFIFTQAGNLLFSTPQAPYSGPAQSRYN